MAAVLDAFACNLASTLANMAKEEVEMLLGVPGEITKLETTLGDLSSILADAERRRVRDSTADRWVRELKDVMYKADNILDLCQIKKDDGEDPLTPRGSAVGKWFCKIPVMSCFRNPVVAHEIGKKIQALNQELLDLEKRSSRFGFSIAQSINTSSSFSANTADRRTAPGIIPSDVVGGKIQEDTTKLVNLLVKKTDADAGSGAVVVAVTGTGGIGKTTLARMVFNDTTVKEYFDKMIWLSVNKEANQIAILQSVLSAVGGNCNGDKAMLEDALRHAVRQNKFLLVMDDVWSDKVWNDLLRVPLNDGASGSRVLVTTRNTGVARGMRAHHVHQIDKIALDDGWSLMKKQVVLNQSDEADVDALKDVGMMIVERCDGLPLAVKVVGGVLLNKSRTRGAWMDVFNNVAWSITETNDDLNKAVYVSYEDLPPHLKQCLLYCLLFPKDEPLEGGVIVGMWMAEGFIQTNTSSTLPEDMGLEYYRELISRNLLEPVPGYYDQAVCTMHDVIRSFVQSVAKGEGLLVNEGQNSGRNLANLKLRYLSISTEATELGDLEAQVSLRTLLLFKCPVVTLHDYLNSLCYLRVLHISDVTLDELPESVCQLKHLRYLGIGGTSISTIPHGIGGLKFLQVLDLVGCAHFCQLPNSILKLHKLRFISLHGTKITSIPCGFRQLENLVQVFGFPTQTEDSGDGWCSLEELGSLSKLKTLGIIGLEKTPSASMADRAKLGSKPHVTWLSLTFTSRLTNNGEVEEHISEEEQERMEGVLGSLCPPPSVENLTISGYFGRQMPQWMGAMSVFGSLRWLKLSDYACCEQFPIGLGQLPFLDNLWVDCAPSIECIGHDLLLPYLGSDGVGMDKAQATTRTETVDIRQHHHLSRATGIAFPKLKELGFQGMLKWREWEWEEQVTAMPALEKLVIENCQLRHLPLGLSYHARALTVLGLTNVSHLVSVENLRSIVDLRLSNNPKLERVANNPRLQYICIIRCPRVNALEDLPALRSIDWEDVDAEALPDYLRDPNLNKLFLHCKRSLLELITLQDSSSEWGKIQHVRQLRAYSLKSQEYNDRLRIYYTKEPYYFDTNYTS